jgi:protein-arginine kinase activator protein McsA
MNDYYNSLTEENNGKSKEEVERDLNDRLAQFVNDERYEDAARLRDYMNRNNIKRDKLN